MARLVLTRRSRRLHRLPRLVLQRHVILQRRAPTTLLLRGLGLRPAPGLGRVWRVWPVARQPLALEPPPVLEPLGLPGDAPEQDAAAPARDPGGELARSAAAAEPLASPAGHEAPRVAPSETESAGPAAHPRAGPDRAAAVPASLPQPGAPPAAPRLPLIERLAGAARKVLASVTARPPRATTPTDTSLAPPPAAAERLAPARPAPQRPEEITPEPSPVSEAEAGAAATGAHPATIEAGEETRPLLASDSTILEAEAILVVRPTEEADLPIEPGATPRGSATEPAPTRRTVRPVMPEPLAGEPPLPRSSGDGPRLVAPVPGEEGFDGAPEVPPAASPREDRVVPAAADAASLPEAAVTPLPEAAPGPDRVPQDLRAPSAPRPAHVAEERRPRRPPPPSHTTPRRPVAPAAALSPEPEVESRPDPASLFERKPEGRSPADWLGRLETAAQEAAAGPAVPGASGTHAPPPAPAQPRPAPAPISMSARRFLRPLVGIDPADVVIYHGAEAAQAAGTRGADALARGEEIVIGTAGSEQEPRMLGLLAHELTHVARYRAPRFVPPVVRGTRIPAGASPDDEEVLAGQVEARVRTIAEREAEARVHVAPRPVASVATSEASERSRAAPAAPDAPPVDEPHTARRDWGGLPAPWEPMPDFVGTAPAWTPFPETGPDSAGGGSEATGAAGGGVAVHRAASDRSEAAAVGPAQAGPGSGEKGEPAPDLDALARQVYAILRRRIAAERRRDA